MNKKEPTEKEVKKFLSGMSKAELVDLIVEQDGIRSVIERRTQEDITNLRKLANDQSKKLLEFELANKTSQSWNQSIVKNLNALITRQQKQLRAAYKALNILTTSTEEETRPDHQNGASERVGMVGMASSN